MCKKLPSSFEFLKNSITLHADLAKDLLSLTESKLPEGPLNRYEIGSIIIFLAGVEKMLNIAFGFLYIAGKLEWKDIVFKPYLIPPSGFIECHIGLTKKIQQLEKLGADISPLLEIIEIRNYFVHSSSIYFGYSVELDESMKYFNFSPDGPTITYSSPFSIHWSKEKIDYYSENILDVVSSFIDTTCWQKGLKAIWKKMKKLPKFMKQDIETLKAEGFDIPVEKVPYLNDKYIGVGLEILLSSPSF
jgi:hypothetical protein